MKDEVRSHFPLLLAAAIASLVLIGGPVAAQLSGDLEGHVQDAQAKALSGIDVTLLRAGKTDSRKQVSDTSGNFHFADLEGGVYIATVAMEGYDPVTCPGVRIVGGTRQLQITLLPPSGERASSCQVTAEG